MKAVKTCLAGVNSTSIILKFKYPRFCRILSTVHQQCDAVLVVFRYFVTYQEAFVEVPWILK